MRAVPSRRFVAAGRYGERFPALRLAVPAAEVPLRDDAAAYGVWRLAGDVVAGAAYRYSRFRRWGIPVELTAALLGELTGVRGVAVVSRDTAPGEPARTGESAAATYSGGRGCGDRSACAAG